MRIQVIQCGKKFAVAAAVVSVLLFGKSVKAAETTTLRVISTTDIHSQVSSENYDVAGKDTNKSLARLNTMIKGAKAEMTEEEALPLMWGILSTGMEQKQSWEI